MSKAVEEFQKDFMALPKNDQLELIDWLVEVSVEAEAEVNEAWLKLAEERSEEIRSGRVKPVSGASVLRNIQERYGVDV